MQAGRLRHRLTIEQRSASRDALGGQSTAWETFATVWGDAQPSRGVEFVSLRAAQSDISIKFTIRHMEGITPAMRVQWAGNPYPIVQIINVNGRDRTLELMCQGLSQET